MPREERYECENCDDLRAVHAYLHIYLRIGTGFHCSLPRARSTNLWLSGCSKMVLTSIPAATDIEAVQLACSSNKPTETWRCMKKMANKKATIVVAMAHLLHRIAKLEKMFEATTERAALLTEVPLAFPSTIRVLKPAGCGSTFTKQTHQPLRIWSGRWNEWRCLPVSRGGLPATWMQPHVDGETAVVVDSQQHV